MFKGFVACVPSQNGPGAFPKPPKTRPRTFEKCPQEKKELPEPPQKFQKPQKNKQRSLFGAGCTFPSCSYGILLNDVIDHSIYLRSHGPIK